MDAVLGSVGIGLVWGWMIALFARTPWRDLPRSVLGWVGATALVAGLAWVVAAAAGTLWLLAGISFSCAVASLWYRAIAERHDPTLNWREDVR